MDELLPIAMSEIGISYGDFMKLTPRQWVSVYKLHKRKWKVLRKGLRFLFAEQTAWLVNISGKMVKEPITPAMIINPSETKKVEPEEEIDWDKLERQIAK